ncbi:MAG: acyl-CoA dehydrogenase family protein, partial [Microbacterium sp.]
MPPHLEDVPSHLAEILRDAADIGRFGADVPATLAWVRRVGRLAPLPGEDTAGLWSLLSRAAEIDVAAARMLEPHLDARAILAQARAEHPAADALDDPDAVWGVFAAEGPGVAVRARCAGAGWLLTGTKPWCSLAGRLTRALVTAWVDDERALFAVDLRRPEVAARTGPWAGVGLPSVVSAPLDLHDAPAEMIGDPGWYLRRPGFAWGGMGVAAVWHGGARPLVRRLVSAAGDDPLAA